VVTNLLPSWRVCSKIWRFPPKLWRYSRTTPLDWLLYVPVLREKLEFEAKRFTFPQPFFFFQNPLPNRLLLLTWLSQGALAGVELNVHVLTTGFWPTQPSSKCILPAEVTRCCEVFNKYYLDRHSGRRLTWQTNMVRNSFRKKKISPAKILTPNDRLGNFGVESPIWTQEAWIACFHISNVYLDAL